MSDARGRPPMPVRAWLRLSSGLVYVELRLAALLLAALFCIILTNAGTRYAGMPIYWIDELAIFAMAWLAFVGTSAMSRLRLDFAVNFLSGTLPPRLASVVRCGAILLVILFGIALAWMAMLWLDPMGLVSAGFDGRALAQQTFNFVYTERTMTLAWPRWAVMSIVPLFSITLVIHGIASLIDEIYGLKRTLPAGFETGVA